MEDMYVVYKVKCKLREDSRLIANFPESIEAIDYIVKRAQKENALTPDETESLKSEMTEDLVSTAENSEEVEEEEKPKITKMVFIRDEKGIYIRPRHVKGLIKEALRMLNVRGYREAVNHGVLIEPNKIYLKRNGEPLKQADELMYRPIRVVGIRGPRSSIKVAEVLRPPVEFEFRVKILESVARRVLTKEVMDKVFAIAGNIGFLGDRSLQEGLVEVEWKKANSKF